MRTIQNSEFSYTKTLPSTALRDLTHKPVAFVLISIFAFCCRVSHRTTVSGDEKRKELAKSSSRWEGHDFLVSLRFSGCYSFRHHLPDLFALHRLTIKAFRGHLK